MTVTKVGGANMIAHAQWPQCPPFPRVAVFYVTPALKSYTYWREHVILNPDELRKLHIHVLHKPKYISPGSTLFANPI